MIELSADTRAIVMMGGEKEWCVMSLADIASALEDSEMDSPFKVITWGSNDSAKIAVATLKPAESSFLDKEVSVVKLYAGGTRLRCSPDCTWQIKRKHNGHVSVQAKDLKSGDSVLSHGRMGKDALPNLLGYQTITSTTLAQAKSANEKKVLFRLKVTGGSNFLLESGLFCG